MSSRVTLWLCGTKSTVTRPSGNSVPAGTPWSLTTITTLSSACKRMERGESACSINCMTRAPSGMRLGKFSQLRAVGRRLFKHHTLDRPDDNQVAEHRQQGIRTDKHQRPFEGAGGADDVAN